MDGVTIINVTKGFANNTIAIIMIIAFAVLFICEIISVIKNKAAFMMIFGFAIIGLSTFTAYAPESICCNQYLILVEPNTDLSEIVKYYKIISEDGNYRVIILKELTDDTDDYNTANTTVIQKG